ncbi:MAG: endonuclease/exonuclease/phosphatase family protein [Clostridia bacterium]|nr:endonuclease/exonuclease/phosphatase family protein [Clostridia bacterium]
MKNLKIMTFNTQHCLNYLEQKIDFDIMAKAILDCDADIVGLNEMRDEGTHEEYTAQVKKLAELTGMKYYYFAKAIDFGGTNPYGNGLLSKFPILNAETIGIPDPDPRAYKGYYETRCVLKAKLEDGITVLAVHFGLNPDEQENAVNTILENLADEKCILMGDFNIEPDNELLIPIREKMNDTADYFDEPKLSWPSDKPRVKIDYVFVSPDIEVEAADIPAIVAADHRPHTAEIKL